MRYFIMFTMDIANVPKVNVAMAIVVISLCSNVLFQYIMKDYVEKDIGVPFDLRECRRMFGQRYLDRDVDIETVSVLMGHSSTRTTELFYGRRKNIKAIEKVEAMWE